MPFTVIMLKSVPPSLRGDLTKWMQEIATGVYVGNFNSRVRENLWKRVCDAVGAGEATISYTSRNEIGYNFETLNSERQVVDYDGIPLVMLTLSQSGIQGSDSVLAEGFSNASRQQHSIRRVYPRKEEPESGAADGYVVIDIETTGLDVTRDVILEIGAVKYEGGVCSYFQQLVRLEEPVPADITRLTGITTEQVERGGKDLKTALGLLMDFIQDFDLVGYNLGFDLKFLNSALRQNHMPEIQNKTYDLIKAVRKEKLFQRDYKLQTSLETYGISGKVPHRALEDAKLTFELSRKVNKFRG